MIHLRKKVLLTPVMMASLGWFSYSSFASEVQTQTSVGTGTIAEELSYTGDTKASDAEGSKAKWTWDLSYTYSSIQLGATAKTPTAAASSASNDHTSAVTGGFGYSDRWSAGMDLNYSKTPAENLSSFGPSLHAGYTFDLITAHKKVVVKAKPHTTAQTTPKVEPDEDEDEEFVPTLNFTVTAGTTKYTQDYLTAARAGSQRKVTAKVGSQNIVQKEAEIAATLSAFEWVDLEISITGYNYNRDVGSFIASLDDPRAIRSGAASFGSTLSGFSSNSAAVDLTFHLPYSIDVFTEYSRSTNATDGSKTNVAKADVSKTWVETWKTGLGFERDSSSTDQQNTGVLTLSYEF